MRNQSSNTVTMNFKQNSTSNQIEKCTQIQPFKKKKKEAKGKAKKIGVLLDFIIWLRIQLFPFFRVLSTCFLELSTKAFYISWFCCIDMETFDTVLATTNLFWMGIGYFRNHHL